MALTTSTISGSKSKNVWLDTATQSAHTGTVNLTGSLGTTTIANSVSGAYGIVVETAPGLGTKVSLRVPKFSPAVDTSP